jgi:hypothetical protein
VNFRGKDLNAAGVRVSGTKITATPDEINRVCDGVTVDVTAANLSELTGGAETDLHSHAASGGGSGPNWSDPVTVTDAQMLALDTAHVDLVPAPTDPTVLLLPLVVFIKQTGTNGGYGDGAVGARLTIGWGGVSANEAGAGNIVSQPLAANTVVQQEGYRVIPVGAAMAATANVVISFTLGDLVPGPGLAISLGASDVVGVTPDATRSLLVWTLYQAVTLPS